MSLRIIRRTQRPGAALAPGAAPRRATSAARTDGHFRFLGNQSRLLLLRDLGVQMSRPGDLAELEAKRTAEAVVQRKCACGVEGRKEEEIKRSPTVPVARPAAPRQVEKALASAGRPLDRSIRADLEPRFGRDFSRVQVHTDERAAESAGEIHARAYTVGHSIVFGAGQYAPKTLEGRRLLAHELTHVLQQSQGGDLRLQREALDDESEKTQPLTHEESDDDAEEDEVENEAEETGEDAASKSGDPSGSVADAAEPEAGGDEPGSKRRGRSSGKAQIGNKSQCPDGYRNLGRFKLTAYVLAQESEFPAKPLDTDPCGLTGDFRHDFLFQTSKSPRGVKTQGSGKSLDGRIIHFAPKGGNDCFEVTSCPKTSRGTCATSGRTVAVDPKVIRLGSELLIEGIGSRVAEDTGGGIKGAHIDIYHGTDVTVAEALQLTFTGRTVCRKNVTGPVKKKKVKKKKAKKP